MTTQAECALLMLLMMHVPELVQRQVVSREPVSYGRAICEAPGNWKQYDLDQRVMACCQCHPDLLQMCRALKTLQYPSPNHISTSTPMSQHGSVCGERYIQAYIYANDLSAFSGARHPSQDTTFSPKQASPCSTGMQLVRRMASATSLFVRQTRSFIISSIRIADLSSTSVLQCGETSSAANCLCTSIAQACLCPCWTHLLG